MHLFCLKILSCDLTSKILSQVCSPSLFLVCKNLFFLLLQSGKKVTSDPSPFVQFTVGHKSFDSKVRLSNIK